jgi:hypothetical protein
MNVWSCPELGCVRLLITRGKRLHVFAEALERIFERVLRYPQ